MAGYIDPGMRPADKLIPWYFVAFFALVFAVNGIFIYVATTSLPGVIEENHYEVGLAYDKRIAAHKAQEALGWNAAADFSGKTLSVELADHDGKPLKGASIQATMVRTVQEGHDFDVFLSEIAAGQYATDIDFPLPGQWDAYIYVTWDGQPYQITKKIVVQK
ncbi:MAG: FixH family protein [Rhodospirillales bacterium]|nr:FixH family protein [Rhodospirillales bacterium]